MQEQCIAIIPARGGSKRIPSKNIRDFNGTPIIAQTIAKAISSNLFQKVYVSTDNSEIADVSASAGATIIYRDESLSDDFTTTVEVISNCVSQLELTMEIIPEKICCLYPVTPLLKYSRISEALNILENSNFDYVFPVLPYESPIDRAMILELKLRIKGFKAENRNLRTQDATEAYFDSGQFYIGRKGSWSLQKPIISETSAVVVLEKYEVIDIDEEIDWQMAERLHSIRNTK